MYFSRHSSWKACIYSSASPNGSVEYEMEGERCREKNQKGSKKSKERKRNTMVKGQRKGKGKEE